MKIKRELYRMGILALIDLVGGQMEAIAQINEARQMGKTTPKQAYDLRAAINEACQPKEGITASNKVIRELMKKWLKP